MRLSKLVIVFLVTVIFCTFTGYIIKADIYSEKEIFLEDREIWIYDCDKRALEKITETGGRVEEFLVSPGFEYLVYTKIINYVNEPGIFEDEEEIRQIPVCSIVIMRLTDFEGIIELEPPESYWIYPVKFLSDEKLFFYKSSALEVAAFFEYDIKEEKLSELDYHEGYQTKHLD